MKRLLITIVTLAFAVSALVAPAAWAQTQPTPPPVKVNPAKPADTAKPTDT